MSRTLLNFILIVIYASIVNADGMIEVFKWKQMDFYNRGENSISSQPQLQNPYNAGRVVFPGRSVRQTAKKSKNDIITSRYQPITTITRSSIGDDALSPPTYIPYNNVPMGATHFQGRLFVTMPRRRIGIPSTLNYIDLRTDGKQTSPKLHAYPNFETNQFNDSANALVSVYRTTVDSCQRLWFIDTGILEYPDNRQQIKRPSIWVIDLKTDRTIKRFDIPEYIVSTGQGLASITIDVNPRNCEQAFAYMPDLVNSQIYVYRFDTNAMWAFSHNYFNFDPLGGDFSIGGQNFRWDDGVFSTTLGPIERDGTRKVYFHAMASNNEFYVPNRVLQEQSNAERSDHGDDFRFLGSRGKNKQSTMHEYDPKTGVIFYNEIQRNGVGCWNTKRDFSAAQHGSIMQDAQRMIYPSDLTIDDSGDVWVMSNSMPIFIYAELNPDVYNFRVWKQNVLEAKRNTVCA